MRGILNASGVGVSAGGAVLLDSVSIQIVPACITAIIGRNGAGKTTLLRVLAGLVPSSGTVLLDGDPRSAERRRRVAFVGDDPQVYPALSVREHIAFVAAARRRETAVIDAAISTVGPTPLAHRKAGYLSYGERGRLAIAGAIVAATHSPRQSS